MSAFRLFRTRKLHKLNFKRNSSSDCLPCPDRKREINLTILGQLQYTGRALGLLLKQCEGLSELRLYGDTDLACGTAMDLSHIDTNTKVRGFMGDAKLLEAAVCDTDIAVIVGGDADKISEDQESLFHKNADIVRYLAVHMAEFNPNAILLLATPPINALIPLISEEYKKAGVYDPRKIIGLSNVSSMRANALVAGFLNKDPTQYHVPTIGGLSPNTTVTVLSQTMPNASFKKEDAVKLNSNVASAECDALEHKYIENASCCYISQAYAAARFITQLIKALKGDENVFECAYVRQTGHIGEFLPYMATITRLGPNGIEEIYMPGLNDRECKALQAAHPILKRQIEMGQSFVTGEITESVKLKRRMALKDCAVVQKPTEIGDVVIDIGKKYRTLEVYR